MAEKSKYWTGVLYPENMIDDWEDEIAHKVQVPVEWCTHDKCMEKDGKTKRKTHVHVVLAFPNTTTYKHALSVFKTLEKDGCIAISKCERVINIKHMHDYLIHDTEDCKKKKKHLYDKSERKSSNAFDIGSFEQVSVDDKNRMTKELCDFISDNMLCNFVDFYDAAMSKFGFEYFDIIKTYSGFFERLCKGNYHKAKKHEEQNETTV